MEQPNLFGDTVFDALESLVAALGGMKRVGYALWPDDGPEKAGQHLRDALNPKHRTNLPPEKFMELLRMGHKAGIHSAFDFVCDELEYQRTDPVNREQQVAELQKDFINQAAQLQDTIRLLNAKGVQLEVV
jgi:hypothetical protein